MKERYAMTELHKRGMLMACICLLLALRVPFGTTPTEEYGNSMKGLGMLGMEGSGVIRANVRDDKGMKSMAVFFPSNLQSQKTFGQKDEREGRRPNCCPPKRRIYNFGLLHDSRTRNRTGWWKERRLQICFWNHELFLSHCWLWSCQKRRKEMMDIIYSRPNQPK